MGITDVIAILTCEASPPLTDRQLIVGSLNPGLPRSEGGTPTTEFLGSSSAGEDRDADGNQHEGHEDVAITTESGTEARVVDEGEGS